jgi:hypothetical protein
MGMYMYGAYHVHVHIHVQMGATEILSMFYICVQRQHFGLVRRDQKKETLFPPGARVIDILWGEVWPVSLLGYKASLGNSFCITERSFD